MGRGSGGVGDGGFESVGCVKGGVDGTSSLIAVL